MKILVVGGAGYIGGHVVRELVDRGDEVVVFDNLSSGRRQNIFNDTEFIEGDILNQEQIESAVRKEIEGVVHLAAFKAAGESMVEPEKYSVNNISGTINLLNAAGRAGVKYFVFSSSAAVYGSPDYLPIDEKHSLAPENYYGFTKLEIERFLHWYEKLRGMKYAALRYFNAAGYDVKGRITGLEINPANLLPVVMEVAAGTRERVEIFGDDYETEDGTGVRDYVHVSDLARAHADAFDYLARTDESMVVNLGSEHGISVLEMVEAARKISSRPVEAKITGRRAGDPAILYASSAKAHQLLGWEAKYSDVETLVESTWRVYKQQRK
ncbi:MAG: UDP-glucose 4-epimerase GalE [Desulfobacterales bacterium]|nr:UDP-glucose 4-epimerase GalE [Desulfobacterales bacterium]